MNEEYLRFNPWRLNVISLSWKYRLLYNIMFCLLISIRFKYFKWKSLQLCNPITKHNFEEKLNSFPCKYRQVLKALLTQWCWILSPTVSIRAPPSLYEPCALRIHLKDRSAFTVWFGGLEECGFGRIDAGVVWCLVGNRHLGGHLLPSSCGGEKADGLDGLLRVKRLPFGRVNEREWKESGDGDEINTDGGNVEKKWKVLAATHTVFERGWNERSVWEKERKKRRPGDEER